MGGLLHLVQRGGDWVGPQPAQTHPRYTKCNSQQPVYQSCLYNGPLIALRFFLLTSISYMLSCYA